MPVANKTAQSMATTFSPGEVPDLPNVVPSLLDLPGMQDQNDRWQEWWDSVRQRLFKTEQHNDILLRQGQIEIREEVTARETADGFLEGKYTLTVQAGDVVTGMEITSSTSPNAGTVSQVSFRADKFMIYSGTTNKIIFVADAIQNKVRMGDVFTVDTSAQAIYIKTTAGAGSFANSNTPFYADATGQFSMGSRLTWNGTTLAIGLALVDSGGSIVLGTGSDVLILSTATDPYRIWAGNATAGSATFSVTKTGQLFSTSGEIGGFQISSTQLSVPGTVHLDSSGSLTCGATSGGQGTTMNSTALFISNSAGTNVIARLENDGSNHGHLEIYNSAISLTIELIGASGDISITGSYLGNGGSLTGITSGQVSGLAASATTDTTNASNITSGTLPNARLSFTKVPTGDVAIDGHVVVGGVKLATVA
jgi:hypothetical protein